MSLSQLSRLSIGVIRTRWRSIFPADFPSPSLIFGDEQVTENREDKHEDPKRNDCSYDYSFLICVFLSNITYNQVDYFGIIKVYNVTQLK